MKCQTKIKDLIDVHELVTGGTDYMFGGSLSDTIGDTLHESLSEDEIDEDKLSEMNKLIDNSAVFYYLERLDKNASLFVTRLFHYVYNDDETELPTLWDNIGYEVGRRYAVAWYKKYVALLTDYKPLDNYNMDEVRTPDLTETDDYSSESDGTLKKHVAVTTETDSDGKTGIFAFNQTGDNSTPTADTVGNQDTTVTADGEENYDESHEEKSNGGTHTTTGTETLKRSGNIGVTTSQQMLQSELELRNYDFLKGVFEDIDKIVCLSIY